KMRLLRRRGMTTARRDDGAARRNDAAGRCWRDSIGGGVGGVKRHPVRDGTLGRKASLPPNPDIP
ncbi:MAG: hypothetical protein LBB79_08805, partial [Prevotellaceae bacterium]|nr:hypothetical protein [Prevotellaceae bacterium]